MALSLDSFAREGILDFVRPLTVGLDGMTEFGYVERLLRIVERLKNELSAGNPPEFVDEGKLFLLAAFANVPAGRVAPDSRSDLLLKSAGIPSEEIRSLVLSLKRVEKDPATTEEKIVHDAMLLETVGAYGVTQILVAATRERMTLAEMAEELESKMSSARFSTPAALRLAAGRIEFAKTFAKRLAEEVAEFEVLVPREG